MDHLDEKRSIYRKHYGDVIKKKRKSKNISQQELADELNLARTTVGRYENGSLDMPSSLLPVISELCGFPFSAYMEPEYDIFTLSEKSSDALRHAFSYKGAYPPFEWGMEDFIKERDMLLAKLRELLKDFPDIKELYCYLSMIEVFDRYEECEMTKDMEMSRFMLSRKIAEILNRQPGLGETMRNLSAIMHAINHANKQ